MQFEILGSFRVHTAHGEVGIPAGRERTVLAILLLHAGSIVPTTKLIEAIWSTNPPPGARNQLQGCISRLRKRIADAGTTDRVIVSDPGGYRVNVGPHHLDLMQFRQLVSDARNAVTAGRPDQAIDRYRAGLDLWRGAALAGVDSDLARHATALDEERIRALEEYIELELATGTGRRLIPELSDLVQQYPHRESLHRALMLALYRSDRQADSLAAYRHARQVLHDELGLEPGSELQRLHQAILNRDPALDHHQEPANKPHPAGRLPVIPRELPADVPGFAGRVDALKILDDLLTSASDRPQAPVMITAIVGTAGVGKTALAVHWAHRIVNRFPDGQLYVNLQGYSPNGRAVTPAEAIRGFLDALGVPAERIPPSVVAQAALYRSLLADRRMLVVLDNAKDADQVRPLLPGSPGCRVVVTSRHHLTSLVAAEGARPLSLDLLSVEEAWQLLARRLGSDRVAAEPGAVEDVITRCTRLPLALAIAAARAATAPQLPVAVLASQLLDTRNRLHTLTDHSPATDLRSVLSWSYNALADQAARLFRLLGLHSGPDITALAAASLADIPVERASTVLIELTNAHLLTEHVPGRYVFHDLLRAYATELALATDSGPERRWAQCRALDHYLHTAHAATLLLNPYRYLISINPASAGTRPEHVVDRHQAMSWLTAECSALLAAVHQAATNGFEAHAWQIAWAITNYLDRHGRWYDLANVQNTALAAAERSGDRRGQACVHHGLAFVYRQMNRLEDTMTHSREALRLFSALHDLTGQAHSEINLGVLFEKQGDYKQALFHAERALHLYLSANHLGGQANALNTIGWLHVQLGNPEQALTYCERALKLHKETGERQGEASTWDSIGYVYHHLGRHQRAAACYQRALTLTRDTGYRVMEASTLTHLGDTHWAAANAGPAVTAWRLALEILDELNHPGADLLRAKLGSDMSDT
jgi:DNA-binding SARP family transcriptional activator/Tfp pilus assembly protein PilF